MKIKKLTLTAMLTAVALVLSYIERFLPLELLIPLPGVKLGLANTVTLYALYALDVPSAAIMLLLRCFMGFFFGGNAMALMFSIAGGALAMGAMALFKRSRHLSIFGVSVLGAAAHSCGQICVASILIHSVYVLAYLPYLMITSAVCGTITAAITANVLRITAGVCRESD